MNRMKTSRLSGFTARWGIAGSAWLLTVVSGILAADPAFAQSERSDSTQESSESDRRVFSLDPSYQVESTVQGGQTPTIRRSTTASSGVMRNLSVAASAANTYRLVGTAGQHDVGKLSGGRYSTTGGFLIPPGGAVPDPLEAADDGLGFDYNRVGDFKMPTSAGGQEVAIRVKLTRMYIDANEDEANGCPVRVDLEDLQAFEDQVRYLGAPVAVDNNSLADPKWVAAKLQCTPFYRDWSPTALAADLGINPADAETIYYHGAAVVPCSIHAVQQGTQSCVDSANEDCFSEALTVGTAKWGDVFLPGLVNFSDIGAVVNAFKGIPLPDGIGKWRSMLRDNQGAPDSKINFTDIGKVVDGFKKISYKEFGPTACP